jgi:hypothetical protein
LTGYGSVAESGLRHITANDESELSSSAGSNPVTSAKYYNMRNASSKEHYISLEVY